MTELKGSGRVSSTLSNSNFSYCSTKSYRGDTVNASNYEQTCRKALGQNGAKYRTGTI